jgi:pilus assembly protein CpaF
MSSLGPAPQPDRGWEERLLQRPVQTTEHLERKFTLHRKLLDKVNLDRLSTINEPRLRIDLRAAVFALMEEEQPPLSLAEKERLVDEVLDELFGLGPLEPLLQDPTISAILVTTPKLVFIERGSKLYRTPVQFKDDGHLLRIMEKIVSRLGRRIDESSPLVEARLPDGSRVNAVIPPLAVDGPLLSIRRFGRELPTAEDLVGNLTLTPHMRELLQGCIQARLNIVISGASGAGKTTLLNALASSISGEERIVTIEEAAELRLPQVHVARLETRPPNLEGQGGVRQRQLVINALLMRPDRLIVGEVRGEEALDMLQAMNTGHDGSLTTIHANSCEDAVNRLEAMIGMANATMSTKSIRQQISSAVDLFLHVARLSDGARRITHITECPGMEGETVALQDIFVFERLGLTQDRRVIGRFRATGARPKFAQKLVASGIELSPAWFETPVDVN